MLACHVTIIHGLEGPSNTIMGAEAGALLSIGESMRIIERDDADLCFAGGAESRVNPHGLLRWELSDKLATATTTDDPADSCKPYDPASQGCFLGEAGGMLVIEEATHAQNRNARVYATLAGFAATQSLTPGLPIFDDEPTESDEGLERAITNALKDANLTPDDIDIVYPLAVGIPVLDAREAGAIESALGPRADQIPWITLSDKVGNTLAAHGAIAAAAAALALSSQTIPDSPTRSPSNPPNELRNALVCTPSLAGQCAALVLSR
jgi:3-oxoacyl-[acyl-carrier-protein] synthase II